MASLGAIHTYRSEVNRIIRFGGSTNEMDRLGPVGHGIAFEL